MNPAKHENRRLLIRLAIAAVGMFGFGFALVPFYNAICQVTGLNNLLNADARAAVNTQVDASRSVRVEFDANTHGMPWQFQPLQSKISVHPGELIKIEYAISNNSDKPITGQAIPSYGPRVAGKFFKKIECFCFAKQTLAAGEKRVMPVVFVVDPNLPKEITTITLSYTFFEVAGT